MNIKFPSWEDLPNISLYNDQVIEYTLSIFSPLELEDTYHITRSMINNYIKLGMLPATEKKKFKREHLALLLMITFFKTTFTVKEINDLIQKLGELDVQHIYTLFIQTYKDINNHQLTTESAISTAIQSVISKIECLKFIHRGEIKNEQ